MRTILILFTLCYLHSNAQTYIIKDIKSFGAKGDGKTNDHDAFEKAAAFFNQRCGNGKLLISKGIYIVGKQTFTSGQINKPAYEGEDLLHFSKVKNLVVEGEKNVKLKYQAGLRFGAFNPETGKPHLHGHNYFVNWQWAAMLGHAIFLDACTGITISTLEMDGSNGDLLLGGVHGDVGIQLTHYGTFIQNSRSVNVKNVNLHNFGEDGISVANAANKTPDDIKLEDSRFEYNGRQGLSWIGGNDLKVKNCKFNHTGQGKFNSPPGAGVDIKQKWDR